MATSNLPGLTVNGVSLDDAQRRWIIEQDTVLPGAFSQEVATVELYGRPGVFTAAAPKLSEATVGLSVAVQGADLTERQKNIARLQRLFAGTVVLRFTPGSMPEREARGVATSFTIKDVSPRVAIIAITVMLPNPVWEEATLTQANAGRGEIVISALAGGSAPARVRWILPTTASYLRVKCVQCGAETVVKPGERLSKPVSIGGWDVPELGARLESYAPVCPSIEGEYKVTVDTDAESIEYAAARSFL